MHKKSGYILFLLFSILTTSMATVMLFMARSSSYRQLIHLLTDKNIVTQLSYGSIALGQSLLYVEEKKESKDTKNEQIYDQKLLTQIFKYLHKKTDYILNEKIDGIQATISLRLDSEEGKLNINSIYNFVEKKFINEGKEGDRKKFCQWLFEKIAAKTNSSSLFDSFESYLKKREFEFNDVTELLQIKEFNQRFKDNIFYNENHITLTDLFTVTTELHTINPWFFSHSWCLLLDIKKKESLSKEDIEKLITNFKKEANWNKDWDNSLRISYQKDYKDIPKEIKSMLTTDCEANIFSLLLDATIKETTSTIFTILKKRTVGKTATFDIVKIYQI